MRLIIALPFLQLATEQCCQAPASVRHSQERTIGRGAGRLAKNYNRRREWRIRFAADELETAFHEPHLVRPHDVLVPVAGICPRRNEADHHRTAPARLEGFANP